MCNSFNLTEFVKCFFTCKMTKKTPDRQYLLIRSRDYVKTMAEKKQINDNNA